jgi:F-type H+-transporting ATPase subunit b
VQIDWFTAIAQIVNFLILLALLKRFLFNRIVDAMDRREAKIAGQLDEGRKKKQQAEEQQEEYEQKSRELEQRRNKILNQAREEAQERKKELLNKARSEVDQQRRQWEESLQRERDEFLDRLKRTGASQVINITERVLEDLAGTELLRAMSDRFVERLEKLPDEQWSQLAGAVSESGEAVVVSSHEIPDKTSDRIEGILGDHVEGEFEVDYQVDEGMLCGLALQADGYQLAWSSRDYLEDLQTHLGELLQQRHGQAQEGEESGESDQEGAQVEESEGSGSDEEEAAESQSKEDS